MKIDYPANSVFARFNKKKAGKMSIRVTTSKVFYILYFMYHSQQPNE